MTSDVDDCRKALKTRNRKKDQEDIRALRRDYEHFINWRDRGILHDLEKFHNLRDPTKKLLLGIALGVAWERQLPFGRHERRRKDLLIGWINANYDHFKDIIDTLVLGDTVGPLSGPVDELAGYLRSHPEDEGVRRLFRESDFNDS
jgi:hypothetical protein